MVSSHAYPGLERKPGGPDNWVERAGGLPSYIERIAKHLHYEKGMTISRAIASAVNTVKRWARMGKVAKYGDPNHKNVTAKTAALAAKAVAEWEAKRRAGRINLSDATLRLIDLCDVTEGFAYDLAVELDLAKVIDLTVEQNCAICDATATKKVIWADGRAYQPSCDAHVKDVQDMLKKKNGDMTELAGVQDLADAVIDKKSTMVALMLPKDVADSVAVEGGVPPEDMHVTLTFHGDTTDEQHDQMVQALQQFAKDWSGKPLKGKIGGLGQFPAGEDGVPHFAPVDVPGINTLHEQVKAVTDKIAPASEDHGYTPHSTLTYTKDGEDAPSPVPPHDVAFDSIHVVRGNKQGTKIPLGSGAGVDLSERAILSAMDIKSLAERANAIEDPEVRAKARQAVFDLSSSIPPKNARGRASDGRPSYKRQGKWGHGFVPLDRAAKEAKAKGSPIAMKRMERLFGSKKRLSISGNRKSNGGSEQAQSVGRLRNTRFADARETGRPDPKHRKEASKSPRSTPRARQAWDKIPDELKTVRNGKRYVMANYQGRQILTEWVGGINEVESSRLEKRKTQRTLTSADAKSMTTGQIRALLKNPRTSAEVRKMLNKVLTAKMKEKASRA